MTIVEPIDERRTTERGLPPIWEWWPMIEGTLKQEVLENPSAPLRRAVVRRICELCEVQFVPTAPTRLTEPERAYLAGWTRRSGW
ncbi:hypothetical protein [Agromyces sp. LHK192]|uniref:hypothetical protein n=1 Tax=Agromyces sp. LHK192 TaxID=2498704 RepID=UPI000FDAF8ED|nr:hypothetical protein [Agromyces sp. LHK192]